MNDYDFKTLNDKEFEVLATDLLSRRDGVKYERFKPGRDGGVDGRYFSPDKKETILQCKHWVSSKLEALIKNITEKELAKIKKLNPDRYILVLSHSLSRADKNNIIVKLSPYIKGPCDILGKEDLNDILSSNQDIERRHYKLWIASSNVLMTFLNRPIYGRSQYLLDEIKSNAHIYVETENHRLALEKLENLGTVIITGPAGIGKTTLAEQLLLYYSSLGYSLHCISEEVHEAESVFINDEKQIFFFDDFLGRNYLEALSGYKGSNIVSFIKRIKKSENKKFILTSRTTILNQGKILNDVFHNNNIQRNEFEISFDSFSVIDKAKILYNHIWHSSLDEEYIDQIYFGKRYKEIINHRNYNPRIIRFITDSDRLNGCDAERYWEYSKSLLDNPADVWENPFEAQHDDFGRCLILLVTLNSRDISQKDLSEAFARFIALPDNGAMQGKRDYLQQIKHLAGSMLNRKLLSSNRVLINLFNPSIGDYVLKRYSEDIPALCAAFSSLRSISSIKTILNLEKNKLISDSVRNNILYSIISSAYIKKYEGYTADYISYAIVKYYGDIGIIESGMVIESASKYILNAECPLDCFYSLKLIKWGFDNSLFSTKVVFEYLMNAIESGVNYDSAEIVAKIICEFPSELEESASEALEDAVHEYLCSAVHDEFSDADVFNDVNPSNIEEAVSNLRYLIQEKFMGINIEVSEIYVDYIIDSYDLDSRAQEYFEYDKDYYYERERKVAEVRVDEIDDLFERT